MAASATAARQGFTFFDISIMIVEPFRLRPTARFEPWGAGWP
jgi:hypothetical protein